MHAASGTSVGVEGLRDLVEGRLRAAWVGVPGPLAGLVEALEYSLLAPGKRVRPVLTLAAADCCGVDPAEAVDVAAAFELVHAYSLVHDDLPCMDDDDLRRGMPTSHVRFGEGIAVLVGDALQTQAFAMVASSGGGTAAQLLEVVGVLARSAGWLGMVGGQYLDVQAGAGEARDAAALRDLHDRKTSALIAGALEAGAVLGGAGFEVRTQFARFGQELGWLFQLVDDLLDEVGDAELTGKSAGSDRRQGKVTAVGMFGVDGVAEAADAQLQACLELAGALPRGGGVLPGIARYVRSRDH